MSAFSKFLNFFRVKKQIAIDLGTSNVLIFDKQKQKIVLDQPSVIVYNIKTNEVIAVGSEAREMIGKNPNSLKVIKPLREGVISDLDATRDMLTNFIKQIYGISPFKPEILICVPIEVTTVERRALFDAIPSAKKVYIMEEGRAALIGSNINISKPEGNMVIDIGGGSTDVAILSLDEIVVSKSIRIAGNKLDSDIIKYVKENLNLNIGDRLAEKIKKVLASALVVDDEENQILKVSGKDIKTGIPKEINVTTNDVQNAIYASLMSIVDAVREVLGNCPPDLASDVLNNGIILTGGGAYINKLDELIEREVGIKVIKPEIPLESVARGGGIAFDNEKLMSTLLMKEN